MSSYPYQRCSTCGTHDHSLKLEEPLDSKIHVAPGKRHHELLNSNEPVLESDIPSIQSAIAETSEHLSSLDHQISGLRVRLKQLEEECTAVSRFHTQNEIILSPLRRMPTEVLGEIFSWTLPSVRDAVAAPDLNRCGFDMGSSPWLLGHISSRWREIALSTPSLWSLVAI
ncbi:hypothetical protein B0H17DRAFT_916453, partial [Mycena rosella]